MKVTSILSSVLALSATGTAYFTELPTTVKGGVEVVDTPLVREAIKVVEKFIPLQPYLYNHVMRCWLFGAAVINANKTLKASVDLEAHALGTILHDLGWDMTKGSVWVTHDNRFEVDGALGAKKFIMDQTKGTAYAKAWTEERLERVFDGIALHGTSGIHMYKNIDSKWITSSIGYDGINTIPTDVPSDKYKSILAEFPNQTFQKGAIETFTWLAATKPDATYNNFVELFGTAYVTGYNATGHHNFDRIVAGLPANYRPTY